VNLVEQEARKWIGTPFHHQGRLIGVGVDCAGVVVGVAHALGLAESYNDPRDYSREPDGSMARILSAHLDKVPWKDRQSGDVVHVAWSRLPQHVGILTGRGTLIHAYGKAGCVESPLSGSLLCGVRQVYRFKGVEWLH
jgi:NlpC/P60 family putative phage cell wall peptidase